MNISYKIGNGTFNYRVAGVLIHNNKILLMTDERIDFWYLPGGRVEMFETTPQALQREIGEELGTKPTIERLLWIAENMFYLHFVILKAPAWNGNVHEICFYYLIDLPKDSKLFQKESFDIHEIVDTKKDTLSFKWFDIATLETVNVKPDFIKKRIQALPTCPEHIIVNELGC